MKRRLVALAAIGALVLPGLALGRRLRPPSAGRGAHLLVYAQEWSLWPSRGRLPAGRVTVELLNRGQDAHDLRIRRLGPPERPVGAAQSVGATGSGALGASVWHLGSGRYELYCSLPGHRHRGMHTQLTVS